jgi:eukaryotic-like serine/threonine-protein kinase
MGIFDAERCASVPLKVRAEAAGQAGDLRLRENNWVRMGEGDEAHEVELEAFEIGRYPVTVEEYGRYVEEGGREPPDWDKQLQYPNRPVVNVSWHEAEAYCTGAGVRLPTEAQWERAARGTEGRHYPWGEKGPDKGRANYYDTGIGQPTPVGLFPKGATPEGIQDLAGNVWEWVADWYGEYPKGKQRNPIGPKTGEGKILRGGSWDVVASILRAAVRVRGGPGSGDDDIGFRCAHNCVAGRMGIKAESNHVCSCLLI